MEEGTVHSENTPGTTDARPTRKRKSKEQIQRDRAFEEKLKKGAAEIEEATAAMVADGGKLLKVHYRKGRYHDWHTVLIYKGGLFFPDHGLCDVHALLAEVDLRMEETRRSGKKIFYEDACFGLAHYLVREDNANSLIVPVGSPGRRYSVNANGMSKEQQEWWDLAAYKFIESVRATRSERHMRRMSVQDPSVRGIPFVKSARKRVDPIARRRFEEFQLKLKRVEDKLEKSGNSQLVGWHTF